MFCIRPVDSITTVSVAEPCPVEQRDNKISNYKAGRLVLVGPLVDVRSRDSKQEEAEQALAIVEMRMPNINVSQTENRNQFP